MANISIFQPDDQSATPPVIFPDSFIALKSTDPGSIQFLQALKLFLEDEERQVLKKLRGSAAAEVADYLDEVLKPILITFISNCGQLTSLQLIMMKLHGNPEFRRRTMRVLRSLCGAWGVLPASYTLHGEVEITDNRPWTHGGFSEVWRGTWRCEKVAVKVIIITGAANQDKLKKDKLKKVCVVASCNLRHQADICSAIVQRGPLLEAVESPKPVAFLWCFYTYRNPWYWMSTPLPRVTMDGEW